MDYLVSRYNAATTDTERTRIEVLESYLDVYECDQNDASELLKRCEDRNVSTMDDFDKIVQEYFES